MDVDSLYTNIDIQAGMRTVADFFQRYPDPSRPDRELLQLLEINLTKNDFTFNGEFYLQVKGTAMGKRFAPSYANIFMANWEDKALAQCKKRPLHYLRYLDDIFGIWTHSREEFADFLNTLETFDPSIRLKHTLTQDSVDFLDTTIYKGPDFPITRNFSVKVYFKDTDTHALLYKTSFHPTHTSKGLVQSQLTRFKRICTKREDFKKAVQILFRSLRKRGYSRSFLRGCLKTFETPRRKVQTETIPLIMTFSTISKKLNTIFKNNYRHFVYEQGLLQNHQVISAYRRNLNLKDYLVRAKLPSLKPTSKPNAMTGVFKKREFVKNQHTNMVFRIQQGFQSPHHRRCVHDLLLGLQNTICG